MHERNDSGQRSRGFSDSELTALERGAMVPLTFSGTVIARFEHAVNIVVTGESLIMALVTRREAMSARTLLLPALPHELRTGTTVSAWDGRARVGGHPRWRSAELTAVSGGEIDFAGAPWYYGHLPAAPVTPRRSAQMGESSPVPPPPALIAAMFEMVREHGRDGGLLGLLDRRRGNVFSTFAARLLSVEDKRRATTEYEKLVGLGGGLTPAGDDFLTGMLAAEEIGGAALIDRDAVSRRLTQTESTTVVGATMLRLALAGMFPAYLTAVGAQLTAMPAAAPGAERSGGGATVTRGAVTRATVTRGFRSTVLRALEYGHSSGTDALVGLLWGLHRARVAPFGPVPV